VATAVGAATAIVVGLVAVTPAAGFVSPMSAILIGAVAAVPSYFALLWRARTRVDDSLDVVAAHGVGGTVGALLTGVLAQKSWNGVADGLLFGNPRQLAVQVVGILATIAFMSVMHIEVSLIVVGAVLTVVGYSLNDTIIIFDRVREDLRKGRKETLYQTLNRSINETLPRSVMTHATTLAATLALLIFAGEVIRPFAWVMAFGIFTGTFSSIYIAGPTLLWIERKWPRKTGISKGTSTATRTSPTRRSTATATR